MAKRHHHKMTDERSQSKRDRYHEHSAMERVEHGYRDPNFDYAEGYKAGENTDRRREEMREAGMIHEDRHAIANMPQHVMIKPYPRTGPSMMDGSLDDEISGVDRQMDKDDSQRRRGQSPHKY